MLVILSSAGGPKQDRLYEMDYTLPYDPIPQDSALRWDQVWELKNLSKQFHDYVHGKKDPAAAFARSWESAKRDTHVDTKKRARAAGCKTEKQRGVLAR